MDVRVQHTFTEVCQWGQHNAVLKDSGADADRLEEFRNREGSHGCSKSRTIRALDP
jgi:hypothetical protein